MESMPERGLGTDENGIHGQRAYASRHGERK